LSKGFPYSAKFHGKWLHCIHITNPCQKSSRCKSNGSFSTMCSAARNVMSPSGVMIGFAEL
jgi:hypothetical protein